MRSRTTLKCFKWNKEQRWRLRNPKNNVSRLLEKYGEDGNKNCWKYVRKDDTIKINCLMRVRTVFKDNSTFRSRKLGATALSGYPPHTSLLHIEK